MAEKPPLSRSERQTMIVSLWSVAGLCTVYTFVDFSHGLSLRESPELFTLGAMIVSMLTITVAAFPGTVLYVLRVATAIRRGLARRRRRRRVG
jgi:hypothetical protein